MINLPIRTVISEPNATASDNILRQAAVVVSCDKDDGSNNGNESMSPKESSLEMQIPIEEPVEMPTAVPADEAASSYCSSAEVSELGFEGNGTTAAIQQSASSFLTFRLSYLIVTLVIGLADGLQGTHLYVLYEGYGFSVASLYCLGFFTGAVTAPITGPLIDKFGRKKSAVLYCLLEIGINMLEQFPFLTGLIFSRMVGGITTNLLGSVFETWLDTEYRQRGFEQAQYELIMRDSVVVHNLAAILSGYVAHNLAEKVGPKGPFEGAVAFSAIALVVVMCAWTENYGSSRKVPKNISATTTATTTSQSSPKAAGVEEVEEEKSGLTLLKEAVVIFKADSRVLRVCILQGLTMGTVQIFVFLWTPALKKFAQTAPAGTMGLDAHGEPAYGLIFGAFMASGVLGGLGAPYVRRIVTFLLSPFGKVPIALAGGVEDELDPFVTTVEGEGEVRPMAVEFLAALCYIACAALLMVPRLVSGLDELSFSTALGAFVVYEFLIGMYSPCEGVIRSLYIPSESRGSMMTLPSIIVNVAVAMGVASTNFVSIQSAFAVISVLMTISACLQISLVSKREWDCLFGRVGQLIPRQFSRSKSLSTAELEDEARGKKKFHRQFSLPASLHPRRRRTVSSDFLAELPESSPSPPLDETAAEGTGLKIKSD